MDRALRAIDRLSDLSGRIFSVTILLATLVVVYEVIMRYAFNSPSAWGFELPIFLAGASYLLSGAYAEVHDAHVKVDLLYSRWSPRTQALVDIITAPVFFVGVVALVWHGAKWTYAAYNVGTRTGSSWNPVVWPLRVLIPIGAFLLVLQGLAGLVRNVRTVISGQDRRGTAVAVRTDEPEEVA
jgi:TRAP-type mannitol/chloroaromatic compound transport system permease small subunit